MRSTLDSASSRFTFGLNLALVCGLLLSFACSPVLAQEDAQNSAASTSASLGGEDTSGTISTTDAVSQAIGTTSVRAEDKPSPWILNLSSENWMSAQDRVNLGGEAPVTSLNSVGAIYKWTDQTQYELRQYFQYSSNKEQLSGRTKKMHQENNLEISNLVLRAASKLFSIGSSKPVSVEGRFYLPTDRVGRENKENGLLRIDSSATWDLSPKWSFTWLVSPRFLFNSSENPVAAKGSDAEYYRVINAPIFTYSQNDKVAGYYAYNLDLMSSQAQRGEYSPDVNNSGGHELGLLLTWGALTINPYLYSDVSLNNGDSALFSESSRAFTDETNFYYVSLFASF